VTDYCHLQSNISRILKIIQCSSFGVQRIYSSEVIKQLNIFRCLKNVG
jgi:hypothetical protein